MPTTTWSTMRQDILRPMGLLTGSTTTNISGSNTLLLDTSLTNRFPVDDYFNNTWFVQLIPTSGDNQNNIRRVIDFTKSSGRLECAGASGNSWPASESGSINYELTPFDPTEVENFYNRARQIVWPHIAIVRDVETMVTGQRQFTYTVPSSIRRINRVYLGERYEAHHDAENLLLNGGFEDWTTVSTALNEDLDNSETDIDVDDGSVFTTSDFILVDSEVMDITGISTNTLTVTRGYQGTGAVTHDDNTSVYSVSCDNWSVTGSGATINQEKQTSSPTNYAILSGNNSVRLYVPNSTTVTLVQTFDSTSSNYTSVATEGMKANLSAWVYCTVSGRVSLTIDGAVQSETHGGTGWELLKGSQTLTQTDYETAIGISVSSGAVISVYVDEMALTLGQSEVLDRPYTAITNWDVLAPVDGASNGGTIRFTGSLPTHHRLRIVGSDMISSVSTDASTVEIDGDLLEPLYNKVRQLLADEMAMGNPESYWWTMARQYESAYLRDIESGSVGTRNTRPRFKAPNMAY